MIVHVWESKLCDNFLSKLLPDIFMAIFNLKNYLFTEWLIFLLKCAKSCVLMSRKTYHKISLRTLMPAKLWPKSQKRGKNCQKKPKLPPRQYGTHFEEDYIPMTNLTIFSHYDLPRKLIQTLVPHIRGHHSITLQASMSGDWSCVMFFYSSIHNFWHTSVKKWIIQ